MVCLAETLVPFSSTIVCTIHVHKENIYVSTVYQNCTVSTIHLYKENFTVSIICHHHTVSTVHVHSHRIIVHHVTRHPTNHVIILILRFHKCFIMTTSLEAGGTSTMMLILFFPFFTF